jgi:hypothetical protein
MSDLKPCPFCGGEAVAFKIMSKNYDYGVRCRDENCEAEISGCTNYGHAVIAWNTREPRKTPIKRIIDFLNSKPNF